MKDEIPTSTLNKLLDPKFYLESFTKIKTKTPGLKPFILNNAQCDLFNTLNTDSRVIILKARQLGMCGHPSMRVLTADLRWVTLDDIQIGEEVVCVDEETTGGRGNSRRMRTGVVEKKWDVFDVAYKLILDNGATLILTGGHRMMSRIRGGSLVGWKRVEDFRIGDVMRHITTTWDDNLSYEDGWFSGMADGEGSVSKSKNMGTSLCVAQRIDGECWNRLNKYLIENKYNFTIEIDERKSGTCSKLGNAVVGKVVVGRMNELFRILGKIRPSRFINRRWWEGKELPGKKTGDAWSKIVSIEKLERQRMIDLQTSEKTFIMEGFVSHNSTAVAGYLYHMAITTPGINVALIGYNSDMTSELLDKVKTFYRTTPESIRPKIQYNSKFEISFPVLDSKILVLPSSENVGRGYTLFAVLLTELAFWDKASEKMLAIEQSVPAGGKIIIESTPSGMGTEYHRMWMGDNGYTKKKYGWWWGYSEPEIDIIKRRINNPIKFSQEYGLEFMSSGRPVFSTSLIKRLRGGVFKIGQKVKDEDGVETTVEKNEDEVVMYFPPKPGHNYVLGSDVAEGVTGGDYSVFTIFDRTTGEEVAFWRGFMYPDRFGNLIDKYGRMYNNSLAVIEINNHGLTTVTALRRAMYPNLYFRPNVKMDTMGTSFSDRIGWKTTRVSKPLMIDDLNEALREGSIKIHTEKTVDEMLTYAYNDNGEANAQSAFHDDCIVATAICLQGFKLMYKGTLDQIDESKHLPDSFSY